MPHDSERGRRPGLRDRGGAVRRGASIPGDDVARGRRGRLRAALPALLFTAAAAAARTPASGPPALELRTVPPNARPGSLLSITIRSSRPLAALTAAGAGASALLEPDESRRVFRGLLAVDLDRASGKLPLTLAGRDAEDVPFSVPAVVSVGARRFPVEKLKVDPALVEPPPEAKARIEEETRTVAAVWKAPDAKRRWTGPFPLPVSAKPSGNFGARRVYNGHERSKHGGVDFPAPVGAAVTAPSSGRVALAADLYFSGGTVILDHGAGLFTSYFHLSRIDVKAGQAVAAGERLGAVGATGRVTGPHLHWSARLGTARIDPLDLRRLPKWPAP